MHVAEEAIEPEVNPTTDSDTFEPEHVESLNRDETRQAIFAMLFASDRPLSAGRIAEALGDADPDIVATMLSELKEEIDGGEAPIELREIAGGYQLTTEARYAPFIRRLSKSLNTGLKYLPRFTPPIWMGRRVAIRNC